MGTEQTLSEAHRLAAEAVGRLSLSLSTRRARRETLLAAADRLETAARMLRQLTGEHSDSTDYQRGGHRDHR